MSATTIVDLFKSAKAEISIAPAAGVDSTPASGAIIGMPIDTADSNNYTNAWCAAGPSRSGALRIQVQTSDSTTSGSFTDPTSGLADFPSPLLSGGLFWVASGGNAASGVFQGCGFLTPHRYVRVNVLSGSLHNAPVSTGVIKNLRLVGSGYGFTFSPSSGTVSV